MSCSRLRSKYESEPSHLSLSYDLAVICSLYYIFGHVSGPAGKSQILYLIGKVPIEAQIRQSCYAVGMISSIAKTGIPIKRSALLLPKLFPSFKNKICVSLTINAPLWASFRLFCICDLAQSSRQEDRKIAPTSPLLQTRVPAALRWRKPGVSCIIWVRFG